MVRIVNDASNYATAGVMYEYQQVNFPPTDNVPSC